MEQKQKRREKEGRVQLACVTEMVVWVVDPWPSSWMLWGWVSHGRRKREQPMGKASEAREMFWVEECKRSMHSGTHIELHLTTALFRSPWHTGRVWPQTWVWPYELWYRCVLTTGQWFSACGLWPFESGTVLLQESPKRIRNVRHLPYNL